MAELAWLVVLVVEELPLAGPEGGGRETEGEGEGEGAAERVTRRRSAVVVVEEEDEEEEEEGEGEPGSAGSPPLPVRPSSRPFPHRSSYLAALRAALASSSLSKKWFRGSAPGLTSEK